MLHIVEEMKSLLPLIALALIVGCDAGFKLPPFRLFDQNSDGSFAPEEVGTLMIEGARVLTMNTGEKLYEVMGNVFPEMRDGKLTEEEYNGIEDGIRTQAQFYLQQLKEHYKQAPGLFEVIY